MCLCNETEHLGHRFVIIECTMHNCILMLLFFLHCHTSWYVEYIYQYQCMQIFMCIFHNIFVIALIVPSPQASPSFSLGSNLLIIGCSLTAHMDFLR